METTECSLEEGLTVTAVLEPFRITVLDALHAVESVRTHGLAPKIWMLSVHIRHRFPTRGQRETHACRSTANLGSSRSSALDKQWNLSLSGSGASGSTGGRLSSRTESPCQWVLGMRGIYGASCYACVLSCVDRKARRPRASCPTSLSCFCFVVRMGSFKTMSNCLG